MGYNSEHAHSRGLPWLVFDIETVPVPDAATYLTEPIEAPSNWKDEAKIAAYITEKRAAQLERAGLDIDLCEVVAISWALPDAVYAQTRGTVSEADMLDGFWRYVRNLLDQRGNLVGFNCLGFDILVLLRRSLYLDVPSPAIPFDKYRHDGVIDVMTALSYGRIDLTRSLAFYAKRFGIPHDDSINGSQIAGLAAAGDWTAIENHVRADVQTTVALAHRVGLIAPAMVTA